MDAVLQSQLVPERLLLPKKGQSSHTLEDSELREHP
jgi:hypothetical protein